MKQVCIALVFVAVCLFAVSCRQQDIRTQAIKTPGMKNAACARVIEDTLLKLPGIQPDGVRTDFQQREAHVTYNSMVIALKNLEFAIAAAGFDANDTETSSNAVAALPPECR